MIVYGKNVFTMIEKDADLIEQIYLLKDIKDKRILQRVQALKLPYTFLNRAQMDKKAGNPHHQGIICQTQDIKTYSYEELLKKAKTPGLFVALDGIQDPHNLGAILRTCDCTGVQGVFITKHNSSPLTPTAIKASTGAAYTVPVSIVTNLSQTLRNLKKEGYWVVGSDMDNARDYREGIYDVPLVLVIGSEGKGISPLVKKQCDYMVSLPMVGTITSLNASVACAVLLYQIFSDR